MTQRNEPMLPKRPEPASATAAAETAARSSNPPAGMGVATLILVGIGLSIAVYLTVIHLKLLLGDVTFGAACGGGDHLDCNSVISSRYGKLFGVPVSVWGIWYYVAAGALSLGLLMLRNDDTPPFAAALLWLSGVALAFDVYLAWAMVTRLERICPLCLVTYVVNLAIFLIALRVTGRFRGAPWRLGSLFPAWGILRQPGESTYYREVLKLFLVGAGTVGGLAVLVLHLFLAQEVVQSEKGKVDALMGYLGRVAPHPVDFPNRPARGPADAAFTIVVFSDFLCSQCRLVSQYYDIVQANYRDSLRIVYMHYPVDQACNDRAENGSHPGACRLAQAAECAYRQGRFWEFHDAVFGDEGQPSPEKLTQYARAAGLDLNAFGACLEDERSLQSILAQIEMGRSVGVTATPTSYINGRPIVGALRPWMLEAALEKVRSLRSPAP